MIVRFIWKPGLIMPLFGKKNKSKPPVITPLVGKYVKKETTKFVTSKFVAYCD